MLKVIVANAPDGNFVFTPHPAVVKKGKEHGQGQIQMVVGAAPPVVFNVEKPDMDVMKYLEFWRTRRSSEKTQANMEISMVDVTCPLPKLAKGIAKSVIVQVPTAVNFRPVAAGDELVLYISARPKPEKVGKLLPVRMEEPRVHAMKKARTAE